MRRWIKVEIDVDKDGDCRYCPLRIKDIGESSPEFCPFTKDTLYNKRLKACLEADITDLLSENEVLKKRNAVLERVFSMVEADAAAWYFEPDKYIKQAEKELEGSDGQ